MQDLTPVYEGTIIEYQHTVKASIINVKKRCQAIIRDLNITIHLFFLRVQVGVTQLYKGIRDFLDLIIYGITILSGSLAVSLG